MKLSRPSRIFLPLLLLILSLFLISCPQPIQPDFYASVQKIYLDLLNNDYNPETAGQAAWPYSYHAMLYSAWVFKGRGNVDADFEKKYREGNDLFWELNGEVIRQIDNGAGTLDVGLFLALIHDETLHSRTAELIDGGTSALNAFVRAFVELSASDDEEKIPDYEKILVLLGKLYTAHPELCELPTEEPMSTDDSEWRDFLQKCLAATGDEGMKGLIEWDKQLENLQDLIPDEPFWDGRLTHAFTLRSIQQAGSPAIPLLLAELGNYREGGVVSGFHKWIYWDLAQAAYYGNPIVPLQQDEIETITDFLTAGLAEGPTGKGEEAYVIANSIGLAPSVPYAEKIFDLIENENTECVRRQLGYTALGDMFYSPEKAWLKDPEIKKSFKSRVVNAIADADSSCGQVPLLNFYKGTLLAFYPRLYGAPEDWELNHQDMVRINEAFRRLVPELDTAEERYRALDLLLTRVGQPDFLIFYDKAADYHDFLVGLHDDWQTSTTFEGTEITKDDFDSLLRLFHNQLGNLEILKKYFTPQDE